MKYYLSCTVALCLTMVVQVAAQNTQQPVYKKLNLDPAYSVRTISPDGKFIAGSGTSREDVFCYNMETDEATYLHEEGQTGISAKGVTDEGMIVGSYGKDMTKQKPALWKDGVWKILPVPENAQINHGVANSISSDLKIIVGTYDNSPCYWELNNGKYVYNALPIDEKDWNGQKPQWIAAYGVSTDGNVISGAIRDFRGAVPLPTVWIRNSEGKYDAMKTLCIDVCLNREFLPGPQVIPEYEDYVTAPYGTPEFEEQMAKWNEVWENYSAEFSKCLKGVSVNPQGETLSPDGKYLTITVMKPFQDPQNPEITKQSSPMRVEIATDQAETYKTTTNENGSTVQMFSNQTNKDGVLFATVQDGRISTTFVYPTSDSEPLELYKWMKEKYNLDMTEDLTYHLDNMDKDSVLTGAIAMSASGNMLVGSSANPSKREITTYSIKLFETSGINESAVSPTVALYAKDGTIHLNGEAKSIVISDMSGKIVYNDHVNGKEIYVGQLQKGIYIVELDTNSGKQFHKIILN